MTQPRGQHEPAAAPEGAAVTRVAQFEVGLTRCLDAAGKPCAPLPAFAQDTAALVELYRQMLRTRIFDHRCVTGGEATRFLSAAVADLQKER